VKRASESMAVRERDGEHYSVQQAAEHAIAWCKAHPGWQRICDIEDVDALYKSYAELPASDRRYWDRRGGENMWLEFGRKPCKVLYGFVTAKGEFYRDILEVPLFHNLMTVYKTS
jgi:hypothetical protein